MVLMMTRSRSPHQHLSNSRYGGECQRRIADPLGCSQRRAQAGSVAECRSETLPVRDAVLPVSLLKGAASKKKRDDGFRGQRSALQGKRDAVTGEGIDETG